MGYNNISIPGQESTILCGGIPGSSHEITADLAFPLLMSAARRVVEVDSYARKGQRETWGSMMLLGQDIHLATLGIVGLSRIREVVTLCSTLP